MATRQQHAHQGIYHERYVFMRLVDNEMYCTERMMSNFGSLLQPWKENDENHI